MKSHLLKLAAIKLALLLTTNAACCIDGPGWQSPRDVTPLPESAICDDWRDDGIPLPNLPPEPAYEVEVELEQASWPHCVGQCWIEGREVFVRTPADKDCKQ